MRGISKFVKTGNLNVYLKTVIALLVLTLVLSNIFIYAQSALIQQELENLQHTQFELENAINELREGNENSTAALVAVYEKTGQFPRRFNETLFSNNKTHIYHFYYSGCGSCVSANERNFDQRLPEWTMNVSEDDFEAAQYNTRTQGQEIAREIFSIFELPESEVTSTQRNRLMLLNNFEGFVFEFSGSILPGTGEDETINAAVMYLVEGSVALMQESNDQNFSPLDHGDQALSSVPFSSVLTLVVVSGLLDGINPCAFAVLLFFAAFLFITSRTSLEETKRRLLLVGLIYILGVYLAYLTIGLGIVRTITIIPFTHLVGKIGAVLVILLGAVNIKDYFWPGRGFSLSMSTFQWKAVRKWMHNSTVLSSFIMGVIVSLFEFPCTGGIYFAILGMLAQKTTFTQGFVYLLIYNVAFVFPLIVLLVFVSRRRVMEFSLEKWQQSHGKRMRLLLGLVMVALGIFLLFFEFI